MAKEKTKDEKIKAEERRLRAVFRDISPEKKKVVDPLIRNAAFTAVSLDELQAQINDKGYTVEYQNGENQYGTKQSDEVKTHIAMTKNLATIIRQLTDLLPDKQKASHIAAMRAKIE